MLSRAWGAASPLRLSSVVAAVVSWHCPPGHRPPVSCCAGEENVKPVTSSGATALREGRDTIIARLLLPSTQICCLPVSERHEATCLPMPLG